MKALRLYAVSVRGITGLIWALRAIDAKMAAFQSYADAYGKVSPHEVSVRLSKATAPTTWIAKPHRTRKERAKEAQV